MDTKRFADTVCRDLRGFIKLYKVRLDRLGWGLSDTSVSRRLKHQKPAPNLNHVGATFEALGLDPAEFLMGLATGFHPELVLASFLQEQPNQFSRFRHRHLRKPPKRQYSTDELREIVDGLESLRFRDARAANGQALEVLRALGPQALHPRFITSGAADVDEIAASQALLGTPKSAGDLAAEAWGVLGVVQRYRDQTATAAGAYLQALHLGRAPAVRARTFQRIAMLVFLNGENRDGALRAISRAREIYIAAGDDSGLGKTFVDEGFVTRICGDCRRARALHHRALRYLTEQDVEHRFGAVQGIALASTFLGETAEAARFLDRAETFSEDRPLMHAALSWLRGELSLLLGLAGEALDHLHQALDAAEEAEVAPRELVLLQLRIAKAHHLQGDRRALLWTLYDIMSFKSSFRRSKSLYAVLSEFLNIALEHDAARVTAELLEETYCRLREGTTATAIAPPILPA